MNMDKKLGMQILANMLEQMSDDGVSDVVLFAADVKKKDKNPNTLKEKLVNAREQVEMLSAAEALVGNLVQKGNRSANTWLLQLRIDLSDWRVVLSKYEDEWQKYTEIKPTTRSI